MNGLPGGVSQDLRYGCRTLAKNPAFAAVAILTLALGIGANTAIFHVLDSVLLRSLPLPDPATLVLLTPPEANFHNYGSQSGERGLLEYWQFQYLREHSHAFSSIFAADSQLAKSQVSISRGGAPELAKVRLVSGDYFRTLGVTPVLGRMFGPETDQSRRSAPFAVISYTYWERRFARNPAALGTSIWTEAVRNCGRRPARVLRRDSWRGPRSVGSAHHGGFRLSGLGSHARHHARRDRPTDVARSDGAAQTRRHARPGTSRHRHCGSPDDRAGHRDLPDEDRRRYPGQRLIVRPGAQGSSNLRKAFAEPLRVLMALVGLVLLIACANVANLLLARGAAREKEFALRLAIGAGRGRAIRQLLIESLLLAVPGAIAGFLLAQWADALLVRMVSAAGGRSGDIQLNLYSDLRVLLFTACITIVTSILFGLAPALRLSRLDLSEALKSGAGSGTGGSTPRRLSTKKLLVVAHVTASLVMLVATGLFVRSLVALANVNLGFSCEHLITFPVDAAAVGAKAEAAIRFHQQPLPRLASVSGIRAATLSAEWSF